MKKLTIEQAMDLLNDDYAVYALIKVNKFTTLGDLMTYDTLCSLADEEPEPAKKVIEKRAKKPVTVDHGKIIALHNANWKNKEIADEMKISIPTVIKHIKDEEEKNGQKSADK